MIFVHNMSTACKVCNACLVLTNSEVWNEFNSKPCVLASFCVINGQRAPRYRHNCIQFPYRWNWLYSGVLILDCAAAALIMRLSHASDQQVYRINHMGQSYQNKISIFTLNYYLKYWTWKECGICICIYIWRYTIIFWIILCVWINHVQYG